MCVREHDTHEEWTCARECARAEIITADEVQVFEHIVHAVLSRHVLRCALLPYAWEVSLSQVSQVGRAWRYRAQADEKAWAMGCEAVAQLRPMPLEESSVCVCVSSCQTRLPTT